MHLFGPQKTVKVPNGHLKGRCVSFILTLSTPNFKVTQNTQSAGGEPQRAEHSSSGTHDSQHPTPLRSPAQGRPSKGGLNRV